MSNKADIKIDHSTGEVFVLDGKGKEVFRREKTVQTVSIAHDIYMYCKYVKQDLAKTCGGCKYDTQSAFDALNCSGCTRAGRDKYVPSNLHPENRGVNNE